MFPAPPVKVRPRTRPRARLSPSIERELIASVKGMMERELWRLRQVRRSDEYELALERRGCHKSRGLGGWSCPEGTKVMRPS